jgi:hypothetical protein
MNNVITKNTPPPPATKITSYTTTKPRLHLISPSKIRQCLYLRQEQKNYVQQKVRFDLHKEWCFELQISNSQFSDLHISQTWAAAKLIWEFCDFIKIPTNWYSVRKSKHNKLLSVKMLLIEWHVSAYSEAIIRFNKL